MFDNDVKTFVQKYSDDYFERFGERISVDPPDPIMIELYAMQRIMDDYTQNMQEFYQLTQQRNEEIAQEWVKREDEAWLRMQAKVTELIKANEKTLNSTFVNAMCKGISDAVSEIQEQTRIHYTNQARKLKLSNNLLLFGVFLLGGNFILLALQIIGVV